MRGARAAFHFLNSGRSKRFQQETRPRLERPGLAQPRGLIAGDLEQLRRCSTTGTDSTHDRIGRSYLAGSFGLRPLSVRYCAEGTVRSCRW